MGNQNFGPQAQVVVQRCKLCGRKVVESVHEHTGLRVYLDPSIPVYIVKRTGTDDGEISQRHVRPEQFFAARVSLRAATAMVDHDFVCSQIQQGAPFDPEPNAGSACSLKSSTCDMCQEPIVWSTEYMKPEKRIPMKCLPIYVCHQIADRRHVHITPAEMMTRLGQNEYAFLVSHHATCKELHRLQRAQQERKAE